MISPNFFDIGGLVTDWGSRVTELHDIVSVQQGRFGHRHYTQTNTLFQIYLYLTTTTPVRTVWVTRQERKKRSLIRNRTRIGGHTHAHTHFCVGTNLYLYQKPTRHQGIGDIVDTAWEQHCLWSSTLTITVLWRYFFFHRRRSGLA